MKSVTGDKPRVLAIIPARGGSKGVPRKNIRALCGKPLIAFTIEVALKAESIDRVVVSTEDEEIAEISRSFGAEVPFLRPQEMARDGSSIGDGINFTVNRLRDEGYFADALVTLYPTHPFRTVALVDFLVDHLAHGHSPVSTVKLIAHDELSIFSMNRNGNIIPLLDPKSLHKGATNKTFFRPYGLFLGTSFGFVGKQYLHVIKNPISLVDIDSLSDFFLAEEVVKQGLFDFDSHIGDGESVAEFTRTKGLLNLDY